MTETPARPKIRLDTPREDVEKLWGRPNRRIVSTEEYRMATDEGGGYATRIIEIWEWNWDNGMASVSFDEEGKILKFDISEELEGDE